MLVVIAPLFLWLGAMSSVPHKEERFAYVVYTQARSRHNASRCGASRLCYAGVPVSSAST